MEFYQDEISSQGKTESATDLESCHQGQQGQTRHGFRHPHHGETHPGPLRDAIVTKVEGVQLGMPRVVEEGDGNQGAHQAVGHRTPRRDSTPHPVCATAYNVTPLPPLERRPGRAASVDPREGRFAAKPAVGARCT